MTDDSPKILIAPSILPVLDRITEREVLSIDKHFDIVKEEVLRLKEGGADLLHLDIMDGQYITRQTFGNSLEEAVEWVSALSGLGIPSDTHLMINEPWNWVEKFCGTETKYLTFHYEAANNHLQNAVYAINTSGGVKRGIAIDRSVESDGCEIHPYVIDDYVKGNMIGMVLIMSVKAGAGGQTFRNIALEHIDYVRQLNPGIDIQVDGGIGFKVDPRLSYSHPTAYEVGKAGANILVAGSSIFKEKDYGAAISKIRECAQQGQMARQQR